MKEIIVGNRVPYEFFVTKGYGESSIAVHAGSFHLALKKAGIERANIMTYSSIIPEGAKEVDPCVIVHGEVMESIVAKIDGNYGDAIVAGLAFAYLRDKKTGNRSGGLVCENVLRGAGGKSVSILRQQLCDTLGKSMNELYVNGFSELYELEDPVYVTEGEYVRDKYGTALAAICFVSYKYPILE